MTAVITECNGTFHQKHQGSHIQSNGNDNLKHSSILFVAAKIAAACAKALHKVEKKWRDCGAFARAGVVGTIWGGAVARAGVVEGAIARAGVSEGAIVVAGVVEGVIAVAGVSEAAIAVALKYLAISMLAQLTGIKIAPVSCANALSINILSATLPGRDTALTGQSPPPSAESPPKPAKAPLHRPSHRPNRPKPRPIGQDTALTGQVTAQTGQSPAPSAETPP